MNTLGDWAYLAIDKHFKKVIKHEAGVLENKDTEELHQMRVGIRRLRSTIEGMALVLQLPEQANVAKVGKISRILGKLRDLDVMTEVLQKFISQVPQTETFHLGYAIKILSRERKRAFKRVKMTLNGGEDYLNIKAGFADWLKDPSYSSMSQLDLKDVLADLLLPQLSNFFLYPTWYLPLVSIEVLDQLNDYGESFHSLRKEAKKLRYNLELFNDGSSPAYQHCLQEVSNIQTTLGDLQDGFVLMDFLKDIFDAEISKLTPTVADMLQKTRLEKWQQWEVQKDLFLSSSFRKDCYHSVL